MMAIVLGLIALAVVVGVVWGLRGSPRKRGYNGFSRGSGAGDFFLFIDTGGDCSGSDGGGSCGD